MSRQRNGSRSPTPPLLVPHSIVASNDNVDMDDDEECVICFEALSGLGGAVPLPCECRVAYCASCWDRALAASMSSCGRALCPSCRCPMHVDFDIACGRLIFTRAPAIDASGELYEDNWRERLYKQALPMQIQLLQQYGAQAAVENGRQRSSSSSAGSPSVSVPQATLAAGYAVEGSEELTSRSDRCSGLIQTRYQSPPRRSSLVAGVTGEPQPRCVCGSRLRCVTTYERVMTFVQEETPMIPPPEVIERLMLRPPIVCDICNRQVGQDSRIWTCENGRRTVLHAVAYDVCEACFALYALGIGSAGHVGRMQHGGEGEDLVMQQGPVRDADEDFLI